MVQDSLYTALHLLSEEEFNEALGFKHVTLGPLYALTGSLGEETINKIWDRVLIEQGRRFGDGDDVRPAAYENWLKQVDDVEQEAYKREEQRTLSALKGARVGDVISYQGVPFEVMIIEERPYEGTMYGVRLSDPETHTPKKAPISASFNVKGEGFEFENMPIDDKGILYYEGDYDRGIEPKEAGEFMKQAEEELRSAWKVETRKKALRTPYEIPADKIPTSLKTAL